ncbi:MAG: hypothetical protein AAB414_02045 [Patescibacteria group bacterium]
MAEFETRTAEFFKQNYDDLAAQLQNRVVELADSGLRIILTLLQPWSRTETGGGIAQVRPWYKAMRNMEPGDWCATAIPLRSMRQSLVVALDTREVGACIRIVRASRFDPQKNDFVAMPREGDIANFLGMRDNERAQIRFLNESDVLYLVRTGLTIEPVVNTPSPQNTTDANRQLERLLQSQ